MKSISKVIVMTIVLFFSLPLNMVFAGSVSTSITPLGTFNLPVGSSRKINLSIVNNNSKNYDIQISAASCSEDVNDSNGYLAYFDQHSLSNGTIWIQNPYMGSFEIFTIKPGETVTGYLNITTTMRSGDTGRDRCSGTVGISVYEEGDYQPLPGMGTDILFTAINKVDDVAPEPSPLPQPASEPEVEYAPVASVKLPKVFTTDKSQTTDLTKLEANDANSVKNFTLENMNAGKIKFNKTVDPKILKYSINQQQ